MRAQQGKRNQSKPETQQGKHQSLRRHVQHLALVLAAEGFSSPLNAALIPAQFNMVLPWAVPLSSLLGLFASVAAAFFGENPVSGISNGLGDHCNLGSIYPHRFTQWPVPGFFA